MAVTGVVVINRGGGLFTIRGPGVVEVGTDLYSISPALNVGGDLYQITGSPVVTVTGSTSQLITVTGTTSAG